ncbi:MAG: NYN domain-containing protein [Candidatus Gribaldobacteria bacterium]|nr:NYN domain-containing protein [Candidatus Gribaldobacteria bacterium]
MDQSAIKNFLQSFQDKRDRTIAVVDFGNVEKWKESLGWRVGIRELARLAKNFSIGNKFLRRFYYGVDYGPKENSKELSPWSRYIFETASMNGFEAISKRVKYIHSSSNINGFDKKCDLDVEMAIDLVEQRDFYDNLLLFSGDGDLMRAIEYLKKSYGKHCMVMSARGHIGREVLDAKSNGIVEEIIFAEDFEYRLNMDRFVKS